MLLDVRKKFYFYMVFGVGFVGGGICKCFSVFIFIVVGRV